MASEERKQKNNEINQLNVHNALGAGEPEAETDAFQCGRCKNVRTTCDFFWVQLLIKGGTCAVQDEVQAGPDAFRRRTDDGMSVSLCLPVE